MWLIRWCGGRSKTDTILGNPEGYSLDLITYVIDCFGYDVRCAIDSTKQQKELSWLPSL